MLALGERFAWEERQRVAIGVGLVYFVIYLVSSLASRASGGFAGRFGGEAAAARLLWRLDLLVFVVMGAGILAGVSPLSIAAFVLLAVFHNFWRPILIGRIASHADSAQTATVLSIDSQANSLFVAVIAPLLGWSVDLVTSHNQDLRFLPIAALGMVVSALMVLSGRRGQRQQVAERTPSR
jgi:hypothetical protein